MSNKKRNWGGRREGAGRPPGGGTGPGDHARINRVVVNLSNDELKLAQSRARRLKLPLGTALYEIVARSLRAAT